MPVEVKTQTNFLKGLNLATGKTTVIQGSVVRNSNILYTKRGSLSVTDGTKLWVSGPKPFTWGANDLEVIYIGAIPFGPLGLTPVALVVSNTSIPGSRYGPFLYDLSVNPATNGGWAATVPFSPSAFGQLNPQLVGVNNFTVFLLSNVIPPTYKDFYNNIPIVGLPVTSYQLGGGNVLGAAHGVYHGGQLWIWNTYPFPLGNDGPSVLRACAFFADGSPDLSNFPVTYRALVAANDGQQGMGSISYTSSEFGIAPTPTLVLFKNFTTYQVTGKFGDGSITITKAQTDMGCVAPRTIQFVPGFGIVRLTHFGVAVFDGVKDTLISEEIRPYLFQQEPDVAALNWGSVLQCVATVTVNPPMYVMAIPVSGIGSSLTPFAPLTRLLCYDLVLKAWTVINIPQSIADFQGIGYIATLELPNRTPVTLFGDSPMSGPQFAMATSANSGGSLAPGTYYLMVTATGLPRGESAAYAEIRIDVGGVGSGTITVSLPNGLITGATGYRVYVSIGGVGAEDRYIQVTGGGSLVITTTTIGGSVVSGFPPVLVGIRQWLSGDQSWDGQPIVWSARLPEVFGKRPSNFVYFRQTIFRGKAFYSPITLKATFSGVQQAMTVTQMPTPLLGGSLYGTGLYGYATYGDAYADLVTQYDLGVTGVSANAEYSGTGPGEILSNDWHYVLRPEGRRPRVS